MAKRRWTLLMTGRTGFPNRSRAWWAITIEALVGSLLFVSGLMLLATVITLAVLYSTPDELYISVWAFSLQIIASVGLIVVGGYQIASVLWKNAASAERRNALVNRAGEIELLNELRTGREEMPAIPADKYPPVRGEILRFRLLGSRRNAWSFVATAILTTLFVPLACILILTTIRDIQQDRVDWLAISLAVFMIGAASWSIFQLVRQWLRVTGVGLPALEVSQYPLLTGQTYQFHLSQPGKIRLRLLEVFAICEEEATYNQGTDIRTERRVVLEERLLRRRGVNLKTFEPFEDGFEFHVPAEAMHSFKSPNNRIQWKIIVRGTADGWPKQERSFVVTVVPNKRSNEVSAA